jgi:hypothetical protein
MLLTQDSDSTVWFGGIDNVKAHSESNTADSTAGPSTAGPAKRKAGNSTAELSKRQKSDSKGKKNHGAHHCLFHDDK